jgi:heme ABC exporter ATP-binding subunit CcmA
VIVIEDVTMVFGRTVALRNLSLEVGSGITGIFGPNGAGKSTLLRLVSGLARPVAGRIFFDGAPVNSADEDFRGRVGYAGHEPGLYGHLTVRENLELFAQLHGAPLERVVETAHSIELDDRLDVRVRELSAGLKRRAAVARAIVHEPDLLLLDEPYANLDEGSAEAVSAALKAWREPGRVALVATHGAKRLKSFADGSVILQLGRAISHRARAVEEPSP